MVRSVILARIHDGLPLAASMDDDQVKLHFRSWISFNNLHSLIKSFPITRQRLNQLSGVSPVRMSQCAPLKLVTSFSSTSLSGCNILFTLIVR